MFKFIKENSYNIFKMLLNQFGLAMLALIMTMATHTSNTMYLVTSILCTIFYVYLLYVMTYEIGQKDKPAIDGARATLKPLKGLWMSLCANSVNIICGIMVAVFVCFIVPQGQVKVTDENAKEIKVYMVSSSAEEGEDTKTTYKEVEVYSDNGGTASVAETDKYDAISKASHALDNDAELYIIDENKEYKETVLYTTHGATLTVKDAGSEPDYVENWASNLYAIPLMIATFLQSMFAGIRDALVNIGFNENIFYIFTPIPAVAFSALAYYMGATGKRLLFFLPERKQKPPKQ